MEEIKFQIGQLAQVIDFKPKDPLASYLEEQDLGAIVVITKGPKYTYSGTYYVVDIPSQSIPWSSFYEQHLQPVYEHLKLKHKV